MTFLYLALSLLGYLPAIYEAFHAKPPEGFQLAGLLAIFGLVWQLVVSVVFATVGLIYIFL